ncbi:MAG: ExbD/TolR family protein [Thermodesulfobacteriota bacterium]
MLTFPRRPKPQVTIPLTSLIDIVFLLLVYFLLTSNFVTQETMDIRLPQVDSENPAREQLVVVGVDSQGNFSIAGIVVNDQELARQLRLGLLQAERREVVVKADRGVRYERVITAMDIAKRSGAVSLHLAIERK